MSTETFSSSPAVADEVLDAVAPAAAVALVGPIERTLTSVKTFVESAKATVYDIATTSGDNTARQLRKRCVDLRGEAKREYEEGNAPFLAAQRKARELVEQINKIIEPVETALDKDIKARETKKAQEKAAREELERIRVGEIRKRINAISAAVLSVATGTSAEIDAKHSELLDATINEELFGDFVVEAEGLRTRAAAELASLYERVLAREQQETELRRQQAELAEQQAEVARQQEARRVADEAEVARKERIADYVLAIREHLTDAQNLCADSVEVQKCIDHLAARPLTEEMYQERFAEAQQLTASTLAAMRAAHQARVIQESGANRIEEQRRQLDEQRQQQADTARLLKEQTDAFEADKKAAADLIVKQKKEADDKAEAELKAIEVNKPADAQEPAASAPSPIEQPVGKVAPALVQAAPFVRATRPDDEDIITCLARNFGATEHDALEWISTFDISAQANRLRSVA